MSSCGNGCGTMSNCGGHCTSGASCGSDCDITCEYYCLHSNCNFSCGGDSTIETGCSSSSCSATGRHYNETG